MMKKLLLPLLVVFCCTIIYFQAKKQHYLILTKSNFNDVDEIDTIEYHKENGIYLLGLVRNGTFGRFSYQLAIVKKDLYNQNEFFGYEMSDNQYAFRVSKKFVAYIKNSGAPNYGWFLKKGKELLPDYRFEKDSINNLKTGLLEYKLHKLNNDTLKVVSNNVDEVFDQQDGLYFVPQPGFGVANLYDKSRIFHLIDSISSVKQKPAIIKIVPISPNLNSL